MICGVRHISFVPRSPQMCTRKYDQYSDPFRDGNSLLLRSIVRHQKKMADSRGRNWDRCRPDYPWIRVARGYHMRSVLQCGMVVSRPKISK